MEIPDRTRRPQWDEVVLALGLIAGLAVILVLKLDDPVLEPELAPGEGWLRRGVVWLSMGTEAIAALVIGWGVVQAFGTSVARVFRKGGDHVNSTETARLRLARTLALGLEFTLASDILRTAVAPTRADILTLAAIVLLRTLLNLFIEREIRDVEERQRLNQGD